jgi:hypothetical protein
MARNMLGELWMEIRAELQAAKAAALAEQVRRATWGQDVPDEDLIPGPLGAMPSAQAEILAKRERRGR